MSPEIARKVVLMFQKVAPPRNADHNLSPRELEVLQSLADGQSYKTCADALSLSLDTVRFHVRRIYQRLHVHSKSEAVMNALRRGIIHMFICLAFLLGMVGIPGAAAQPGPGPAAGIALTVEAKTGPKPISLT